MSRRCSLVVVLGAALLAAPALAAEAPQVSVTVDRPEITTQLGGKTQFRSTVTNDGSTTASGLIAHLNVLSLRPGTYVDPEDWSSQRTHYLDPIPAGGSTTVTWHVQAVNDGDLGMYVAVLPESGAAVPPVTGPTVHLTVTERKTLNSGGILPLALGIPALLGGLALGVRFYRSRRPIR